jgi:hypothetical protein
MTRHLALLLSFPLLLAGGGCTATKSSTPLSPSVAGPIPGVEIAAPKPLEPNGVKLVADQQPVSLLLENAFTTGPRPLSYVFEVATDAGFTNLVFSRDGIAPGDNGRTSLRLPDPLAPGRTYYWRGRAQDGANAGPYSTPAAFEVVAPVVIGQPVLISPINNVRVDSLHPRFTMGNAPRSGPADPIAYVVELSNTDSFATKLAVWTIPEQPNQTSLDAPQDLAYDRQYFWHARAYDGTTTGAWSTTQVFRTPTAPPPPPPTPSPVPGGGGASCKPATEPFNVVECQRSQFPGHMGSAQVVVFLQNVARDLNAKGFSGGPFGLLRKTGGDNCGGYSCDIICSGAGNAQKQWDILGDSDNAQTPAWIGPKTYPDIRVDTCTVP